MKRILWLLPLWLALAGCSSWFDIHPYDVNFDGPTSINLLHKAKIEQMMEGRDTVRFAVISDTHTWYSETKDEVKSINARGDIDFVVHCGDLTDDGTAREYEWIRSILFGLRCPFVAMIGNHDFLGTGDKAYTKMFGPMDFSLIAVGVKFVFLNTNATEYDYLAAVPNFDFMENEMLADSSRFSRTILFMHAAPFSDQFNNNVAKAFHRYIQFFPGLMFCVYGHDHANEQSFLYGDNILFYGVGSASRRKYRVFTLTPNGYEQEIVAY